MPMHDDPVLDAELDARRDAPPPSARLRRDVLAAIAREPRTLPWRDALAALWRELGGARLAAPAFAMALAAGLGLGWAIDEPAGDDDAGDDLIALAQLDDTYSELEP